METVIEKYEKEIEGTTVSITVKKTNNKESSYYAISSLNVDGAGKTIEEAKGKCESATKMQILMSGI
ncbi:hypothetical protein [Virgibacillus necropolis]|uniref:Uncharacterized protein n=1 Tax=Virgibacillus necropolis TaxID=163877 RepID=A0A221MAQ3_9BACI|nr:hypothetical protein [Virgibacillus necropolis]ASN04680.1 hypothetical protein CFK40_06465 [Virgibacillus necropolis]